MSGESVQIARYGAERVGDLEELYATLHEHHVALAPRLAGYAARTGEESWRGRSARYRQWLRDPGSFLLIAEHGRRIVGYTLGSPGPGLQGWQTRAQVGDLHDIVVAVARRGEGIGSMLLDRAYEEFGTQGITECRLIAIEANESARRLYERRGMRIVSHVMIGSIAQSPPPTRCARLG